MTMKLYCSLTSPYARKARIAAIERNLEDQVELVVVNPFAPLSDTHIPNPLSKVPALQLEDGTVLFDSPVICAYLLNRDAGPASADGLPPNWHALRQQALGDGILDAALNIVMERRRPEAEQSSYWMARWFAAIESGLDAMESEIDGVQGFGLGAITYACALGYLDFRLPETAWREGRPKVAHWYAKANERPSVRRTVPSN